MTSGNWQLSVRTGVAAVSTAVVALVLAPMAVSATTRPAQSVPPTQGLPPLTSVGRSEGSLNLVAQAGDAQAEWVRPFQRSTGCRVTVTYARTSSEAVSLMSRGGGRRFDLVAATGDVGQQLIYGGNVRPVNVGLVPSWKQFHPFLESASVNTVSGYHYGVSYRFGPNVLLYSTHALHTAPVSWSVLYSRTYRGKVTVPNNAIQIADAALYLSKARPKLKIRNPYELTQAQFNATMTLLRSQRPLVNRYWALATQEISLLRQGAVVLAAGWPSQTAARAAGARVAGTIPREGATWWIVSWLLATAPPHPNCAYKWMQWVSTPKVQAQQAASMGDAPVNAQACKILDQLERGGCAAHHAGASERYLASLRFWQLPLSDCGGGHTGCVPFAKWKRAWTQLVG